MKRLNVFILTCTLLIICGFLPADASLDFPDSAGVVNSQIVVYIFYQFEYYSEEIDVTYNFGVYEDNLCIKAKNGKWIDLTPTHDDRFKVDYITLDFKRDSQDNVNFFLLDAGERVIDLRFNKVQ